MVEQKHYELKIIFILSVSLWDLLCGIGSTRTMPVARETFSAVMNCVTCYNLNDKRANQSWSIRCRQLPTDR